MLTLNSFWSPKLGARNAWPSSLLKGWSVDPGAIEAFVEPTMSVREGNPETAEVIIVAAPGAVGKTTFARNLAHSYGLAYVDLAITTPLGGNFFTGGITRAFGVEALQGTQQDRLGLIVDGLDEAQLRATPDGFEAGIEDLSTLLSTAKMARPPVLFGRSLAAEEAWLILASIGRPACLLEIDFFDDARAKKYIESRMAAAANSSSAMAGPFATHRDRFVELGIEIRRRLVSASGETSNRFTGYAPILDAICSFALDEQEPNAQAKLSKLDGQTQVELITEICSAVLAREQQKLLQQLREVTPIAHHSAIEGLFSAAEQRARVASVLFGSPSPSMPTLPTASISKDYGEMVQRFLPAHPFLDGSGKRSANAVFSADLLIDSLFSSLRKRDALQAARSDPKLLTGLVFDLYLERHSADKAIPLEDVGVLYEALKSQINAQQRAALEISEDEISHDVEIYFEVVTKADQSKPDRTEGPFKSTCDTVLELRTPMANVSISAPLYASLGDSSGLLVEAPCEMNITSLTIAARHVLIHGAGGDRHPDEFEAAIFAASEADTSTVQSIAVQNATLSVSWPGVRIHPWTNYAFEPPAAVNPELDFMRRRLRRIVTAFRSHSKGALVRLAAKIDHLRMTKDLRGVRLLDRLLSDGILSPFDAGKFYQLHPQKLAELMGLSYFTLQQQQYTKKSDEYLEAVLADIAAK